MHHVRAAVPLVGRGHQSKQINHSLSTFEKAVALMTAVKAARRVRAVCCEVFSKIQYPRLTSEGSRWRAGVCRRRWTAQPQTVTFDKLSQRQINSVGQRIGPIAVWGIREREGEMQDPSRVRHRLRWWLSGQILALVFFVFNPANRHARSCCCWVPSR